MLEAIGRQRWNSSPTWAASEFAAALGELRQALETLEHCAGNRHRTNLRFRAAAGHVLADWREHYRRHLAPLLTPDE